ncbi:hypothetical protein GCM10027161_59740 [Microbispora hainanensis]
MRGVGLEISLYRVGGITTLERPMIWSGVRRGAGEDARDAGQFLIFVPDVPACAAKRLDQQQRWLARKSASAEDVDAVAGVALPPTASTAEMTTVRTGRARRRTVDLPSA